MSTSGTVDVDYSKVKIRDDQVEYFKKCINALDIHNKWKQKEAPVYFLQLTPYLSMAIDACPRSFVYMNDSLQYLNWYQAKHSKEGTPIVQFAKSVKVEVKEYVPYEVQEVKQETLESYGVNHDDLYIHEEYLQVEIDDYHEQKLCNLLDELKEIRDLKDSDYVNDKLRSINQPEVGRYYTKSDKNGIDYYGCSYTTKLFDYITVQVLKQPTELLLENVEDKVSRYYKNYVDELCLTVVETDKAISGFPYRLQLINFLNKNCRMWTEKFSDSAYELSFYGHEYKSSGDDYDADLVCREAMIDLGLVKNVNDPYNISEDDEGNMNCHHEIMFNYIYDSQDKQRFWKASVKCQGVNYSVERCITRVQAYRRLSDLCSHIWFKKKKKKSELLLTFILKDNGLVDCYLAYCPATKLLEYSRKYLFGDLCSCFTQSRTGLVFVSVFLRYYRLYFKEKDKKLLSVMNDELEDLRIKFSIATDLDICKLLL
jgi:hypothetical protein